MYRLNPFRRLLVIPIRTLFRHIAQPVSRLHINYMIYFRQRVWGQGASLPQF